MRKGANPLLNVLTGITPYNNSRSSTIFMYLAGSPLTTVFGSVSFVTNAPAATKVSSAIVIPGRIIEAPPTRAPFLRSHL